MEYCSSTVAMSIVVRGYLVEEFYGRVVQKSIISELVECK